MQEDADKKSSLIQSVYPTAANVEQPIVETPKPIDENPRWYSIASFMSALVPIALWIYAFVLMANANTPDDYSGIGKVFSISIVIWYYFSIGLPLAIFSIVTGIRGLNSNLHALARISLSLKLCTIVFVLYILFSK